MIAEKINNYCTDQNLIVRYPNGAGGKFFITCMFLFDQVAHWSNDVYNQRISHLEWFNNTWPKNINEWSIIEPNQPWGLNFYSRRYDRNNNLSPSKYNRLCHSKGSEYFHKCWNQGLIITDHWHKRHPASFHQLANVVEITLDNSSLDWYKNMCMHKLWLWNSQDNTVISTLDHPDYAHTSSSREMRKKFKNEYVLRGYQDYDDFFYNYLVNQPYIKPFINVESNPNAILNIDFTELLNIDTLVAGIEKLEKHFNQSVNLDVLKQMHTTWSNFSQV